MNLLKTILTILSITAIICSCENKENNNGNVDKPLTTSETIDFIDVDINGDFKNYYSKLDSNYINLVKGKYSNLDNQSIYDSIMEPNFHFNQEIKNRNMFINNVVIKEYVTNIKYLSIIKYRNSITPKELNSPIDIIKVILKIRDSNSVSFIPYTKYYTPNIDSLITYKYNKSVLDTIAKALKYEKFVSNDKRKMEILNKFNDYTAKLKSKNLSCFDYLYPPIQNSYAKNIGASLSKNIKIKLIDTLSSVVNKMGCNDVYVQAIDPLHCALGKEQYLLSYIFSCNKNIYMANYVIVFIENGKVYFVSYDKNDFNEVANGVFDMSFINCIENQCDSIINQNIYLKVNNN
jgi:hypothetical protein